MPYWAAIAEIGGPDRDSNQRARTTDAALRSQDLLTQSGPGDASAGWPKWTRGSQESAQPTPHRPVMEGSRRVHIRPSEDCEGSRRTPQAVHARRSRRAVQLAEIGTRLVGTGPADTGLRHSAPWPRARNGSRPRRELQRPVKTRKKTSDGPTRIGQERPPSATWACTTA